MTVSMHGRSKPSDRTPTEHNTRSFPSSVSVNVWRRTFSDVVPSRCAAETPASMNFSTSIFDCFTLAQKTIVVVSLQQDIQRATAESKVSSMTATFPVRIRPGAEDGAKKTGGTRYPRRIILETDGP
mmetsp:Transcript_22817/g.44851  ORF Transcript_22817/g.44851 Transcript_22817/m.44851 type:complete len:127 (+) Transcript_22817:1097-1477(+)